MNMIVNKSDLVGYEAVENTKAKKEALAKIVAAWESKQAKNAARFGGLGFLAVSLAACNSSSDDTTTTTPATTTPTTPTVTAGNVTLAATGTKDVSSEMTSVSDTVSATQATLTAGHIIIDPSSSDSDTLTVTTSTGASTAPTVVTGVENVVYNNTSLTAASNVDVANILGANITVNHTANALVAPTTSQVSNVSSGSTLTMGTSITGTSTITVKTGSTGVTINAGASELTVGSSGGNGNLDGVTVNGGTSTTMTVNLQTTDKNITVNGGSGAGTQTVDFEQATGVSFTSGAASTTVVGTDMLTGTITVGRTGTTATPTVVNIDGSEKAGTTDAATLSAAGVITLDARGAGNEQVETLNLSGSTAAVTYNISATDAPTSIVMSGSQNVTVAGTDAQLAALGGAAATLTISEASGTTGTTTVKMTDIASTAAARDFSSIGADVIESAGDPTQAGQTFTFANNATLKISTADHTKTMTLDVTDGSGTTTLSTGAITLDLAKDLTGVVTIEGTADLLSTVNITASAVQSALDIRGGTQADINISGASNVTTAATITSKHINGSAMTGNLATTVGTGGANLKATGGSGDDSFTIVTAQKVVVDGGAGNDKVVTGAASDNYQASLTGIEVIDISAGNATFSATQLSGKSYIIDDDGGASALTIANGANYITESTIDLTTLSFADTAVTTAVTTTAFAAKFAGTQGFTIKGTGQTDSFTGSANADTLEGNAGADTLNGAGGNDDIKGGDGIDTIDGGAGNDTIDGGAGADLITLGAGNDTVTGGAGGDDFILTGSDSTAATAATLAAAVDTITDFGSGTIAAGGDEIDWDTTTTATVAYTTAASTGTAQIATAGKAAAFAAADDTLAEKLTAVEAAINASGTAADGQAAVFTDSGNTYVFISNGTDGIDAGDALISLGTFDASSLTLTVEANDFTFV